jgi:hypothetical protein
MARQRRKNHTNLDYDEWYSQWWADLASAPYRLRVVIEKRKRLILGGFPSSPA